MPMNKEKSKKVTEEENSAGTDASKLKDSCATVDSRLFCVPFCSRSEFFVIHAA